MTRKALTLMTLAALALTLLLGACSGQGETGGAEAGGAGAPQGAGAEAPSVAGTSVTVTDMTGRTVTLEKPAEKVVALTASSCEVVYALGAGPAVVGRGEYCDWPVEALEVEALQSGAETNVEQIIARAPDLVLMETMGQNPEQVKQLEDAGIAVYASQATDIAETYESILQTGTLLGRDAEAQELVSQMKATFDDLSSQKVEGTVYFEVSPLEYGLWAAGSGTFMNEVAELIGLTNVFSDVEGWAEVSEEQVLERDPGCIVTIAMSFGEGPLPADEIRARPSWQNLTAVKDGRILSLADNELSRPGPRLADGARALYDFVKGDDA
jgi:iron complex transport system substrate-binding protein